MGVLLEAIGRKGFTEVCPYWFMLPIGLCLVRAELWAAVLAWEGNYQVQLFLPGCGKWGFWAGLGDGMVCTIGNDSDGARVAGAGAGTPKGDGQ